MSADFAAVEYPLPVGFTSKLGNRFSTSSVRTGSGFLHRNQNWRHPLLVFDGTTGVVTDSDLATLLAFHQARAGSWQGFLLRNRLDSQASAEVLSPLSGSTTQYQLSKSYDSSTRIVSKPKSGTVLVYLDGVQQSSGFTIDYATGIITFSSAPGAAIVTADFEFFIPVHFREDELSASLDTYRAGTAQVTLEEIRL